nr:probable caffeoyl-CoA O-methyltransferase 3 [Rhipicephalus microplus]
MGRSEGSLKEGPGVPEAAKYSEDHSLRLHPVQKKLMEVTKSHYFGSMLGDSCQLQFFQILLKTMSAKKYLEIGTFTGYSAVSAALALPPDGKVVALDLYENLVNVGRPHWKEAGVEDKIEMRFGQAVESLALRRSSGELRNALRNNLGGPRQWRPAEPWRRSFVTTPHHRFTPYVDYPGD